MLKFVLILALVGCGAQPRDRASLSNDFTFILPDAGPPPPCIVDTDCPCEDVCIGSSVSGGDIAECGRKQVVFGTCVLNCTPEGCIK